MRTFKGTQGPWFRGGIDNGKISINAGNYLVALVDEGNAQMANAKLIISSPDLLTSLQNLIEVYDSEDGKQWTTSSKKEAIAKARTAIDKVLGE